MPFFIAKRGVLIMVYKPLINPIYPVYFTDSVSVRVGITGDKMIEFDDENGSIYQLIKLMDGTRDISDITRLIQAEYPEITYEEIKDAISEIERLGFLTSSNPADHELKDYEMERFKGNINFISHYTPPLQNPAVYQEKLSNSHITIIGMGAFGCSILFNAAGLGIKRVRIIDFDTVSLSNLNRQMLFSESDIGRLKVDAAKEFMHSFYSDMEIETIDAEIDENTSIEALIAGTDLVILAADQPYLLLPRWLNKACTKMGVPFVGGGINLTRGQVYTIIPGVTGCLDCSYLENFRKIPDYESIVKKWLELNFIPPNTATAPTLMMITGLISSEIFKLLTGLGNMITTAKRISFDFNSYEIEEMSSWERQVDCPACGKGNPDHPLFKLFDMQEFAQRGVIPR